MSFTVRTTIFILLLVMTSAAVHSQYIPKFDVQGHRGARGLKPENTVPAFLVALDYGVTTVEMDLAITKDKQIIVSHEPWMSGKICLTPNGQSILEKNEMKFNIYQMTYDEVKQFDCGSMGNKDFPQQQKIHANKPLLKDVIIAIENHIRNFTLYEVDYNIEIKCSPEGDGKFHPTPQEFSDLVYDLLDQYLPLERVVIQSFDFRVLKYWHEKYPEVRLAVLIENAKSIQANLNALGFIPSIYSPYYRLVSAAGIKYLQQKKIRVIPWTVNERNDMRRLKNWGVNGIITDYPDRAYEVGLTLKVGRR